MMQERFRTEKNCGLCKILFSGWAEVKEEERSLAQKLANLVGFFFSIFVCTFYTACTFASKAKGRDSILTCS